MGKGPAEFVISGMGKVGGYRYGPPDGQFD
ncbi:MAG: hypothetical protein RL077_2578 [Verrucomicrobiota bacterium]|jgi:hypothetical protein